MAYFIDDGTSSDVGSVASGFSNFESSFGLNGVVGSNGSVGLVVGANDSSGLIARRGMGRRISYRKFKIRLVLITRCI